MERTSESFVAFVTETLPSLVNSNKRIYVVIDDVLDFFGSSSEEDKLHKWSLKHKAINCLTNKGIPYKTKVVKLSDFKANDLTKVPSDYFEEVNDEDIFVYCPRINRGDVALRQASSVFVTPRDFQCLAYFYNSIPNKSLINATVDLLNADYQVRLCIRFLYNLWVGKSIKSQEELKEAIKEAETTYTRW